MENTLANMTVSSTNKCLIALDTDRSRSQNDIDRGNAVSCGLLEVDVHNARFR